MLGHNLTVSQFATQVMHDPALAEKLDGMNFFGPVGDLHIDTILLSWACMGGILATCAAITPTLTKEGPGGPFQACAEGIYSFCRDLSRDQIGERFKPFVPLIAGIFIFVLIGNLVGIGPWKAFETVQGWPQLEHGHPFELAAPTTDFNVTFGLALVSLFTYLGAGFWAHGVKYLKLFTFDPMFWVEWLDIVTRPATLAIRLLAVITADELMRGAFLLIIPVVVPTAVMGFEVFIALIQAFVFALLTSVYIGLTVQEHH